MHRRADKDTHTIQALNQVSVVTMDESQAKSCQAKIFAQAPHEVSSLWIRKLDYYDKREHFLKQIIPHPWEC